MRKERLILGVGCVLLTINMYEQTVRFKDDILETFYVYPSMVRVMEKDRGRVTNYSILKPVDKPIFTRIKGVEFKNGQFVGSVLNWLLPNAGDLTGGCSGVAFRTNRSNSTVEGFYVRPANSRDRTLIGGNTVQYFSLPAYKLDKLKKTNAPLP